MTRDDARRSPGFQRWRAARAWAFALACMVSASPARAQAPADLQPGESLYEVQLADGSMMIARVLEVDGDRLTLETAGGARVEVARSAVARMRAMRGRIVEGEFWEEDPHATRLFFGPTGRSLPRGAGYFAVYEMVMPFVAYGVTDGLTLAGGMPLLMGETGILYLAPRLQLGSSPTVNVSIGAIAFTAGEFGGDAIGVFYGVGTFGDADRAWTVGAGWGFAGNNVSNRPAMLVGGESRVSRRFKLITENYFVPGEIGALLSGGVRFISGRLSSEVGSVLWWSDGRTNCCLPVVGFAYNFGRGR